MQVVSAACSSVHCLSMAAPMSVMIKQANFLRIFLPCYVRISSLAFPICKHNQLEKHPQTNVLRCVRFLHGTEQSNGRCVVELDPTFLKILDETENFNVILTEEEEEELETLEKSSI